MNWNILLTIACVLMMVVIVIVTVCMVAAMKRDVEAMDEERKRELRDWNENQ